VRVGTSCLPSITGGTDYNFKASLGFAGVLAATRIASRIRDAVTTFGTLPQSIQGQSNSRWTTSLGITLAQPHAVVRASPILAGTGSFIHLPDKEFRLRSYPCVVAWAEALAVLLPACRHADGTISSPDVSGSGVWSLRILNQLGPGLLTVHGRDDLDEIGEAGLREVSSHVHLFNAVGELVEVRCFRSSQWVLPKVGNHHISQVRPLAHHESIQRFMVVVVSGVDVDGANSESTCAMPRGTGRSSLLE
jgi:hypothetical protein